MKLEKTLKLTYTAMLTAMVCVATMLIRIPTMVGYTNLGDGFILLSAFLFGPFYGAVAGGIGGYPLRLRVLRPGDAGHQGPDRRHRGAALEGHA